MKWLLWYDNSKRPLAGKVEDAAERHHRKFGKRPDMCLVNEKQVEPVGLDGVGGSWGGERA